MPLTRKYRGVPQVQIAQREEVESAQQALPMVHKESAMPLEESIALHLLGLAALQKEDLPEAEIYLAKSLVVAEEAQDYV